jgi:phosphate starvation-inducible PhoH-like protein
MSKNAKRFQQAVNTKPQRRDYHAYQEEPQIQVEFKHPSAKPIETLSDTQDSHKESLIHDTLVVAIGPAGVGKTYLSAAVAAELYKQKHFKYIILTRPNVETGKSLGFLPGDMSEKYAPYLEPFKKALIDRLGSERFRCDYMKRIMPKPLAYMRGDTFDDSIVLLDEAQNTTVTEMKMFITRIGINSKVFITGDTAQSDLRGQENGLDWLVKELRRQQKAYDIFEYDMKECVRSGFVLDMLDLISKAE